MIQQRARELRKIILKASASLSDSDALTAVELFAEWEPDTAYTLDERIRYHSQLYRVVQSHTSQSDWTPDITPALYTPVAEPGEIPVWKRPTGAHDAYRIGDKVWYPVKDSTVYENLIDYNTYSPEELPTSWKQV